MIATNNDSVYETAHQLSEAGANVTVLDSRTNFEIETNKSFEIRKGCVPYNINGSKKIHSLDVSKSENMNKSETINCDQVLLSGGWSPAVHLLSHRGVRPKWDYSNACFLPSDSKENITMVGSSRGLWNKNDCIASGIAGTTDALNRLGISKTCLLYTSPSPRDRTRSRMPSSA